MIIKQFLQSVWRLKDDRCKCIEREMNETQLKPLNTTLKASCTTEDGDGNQEEQLSSTLSRLRTADKPWFFMMFYSRGSEVSGSSGQACSQVEGCLQGHSPPPIKKP